MRQKLSCWFPIILVLCGCAELCSAQAVAPIAPARPAVDVSRPAVQFEKYALENGLQVILAPDHRVPTVFVDLMYHVGSKNEDAGSSGLAHLFEHMMFEGSKDAPGEYFNRIEKLQGSSNGATTQDLTEYFETVPAGSLEHVLWLESDRLATLGDSLTQERFDNQKAVVQNEGRERMTNQPYGIVDTVLRQSLYPAEHPYAHSAIGTAHDVRRATLEDAKEFFATYYAPNNLSLTIVGDLDVAATKRWIEKYFGPIPPSRTIVRPVRWIPHLSEEKVVEVRDHVPEERTWFAWPAPAWASADTMRLEVAARILRRRLSADLIYAEKPMASEVDAALNSMEDSSEFAVMASARPGAALAQVEGRMRDEIALLVKDGPTQKEMDWAKSRMELDEASAFDTLQSKAEMLNRANVLTGDPGWFAHRWNELETMNAADVQAAVRQWIGTENRLVVRYHPDTSGAEITAALDRAVAPPIHPNPALRAPVVETTTLPNGLRIFVARREDAPKVSVQLAVRAGCMHDPTNKSGLAVMTVTTMSRGTTTRTGTEIRDAMEDAGATTIGNSLSPESAGLNFDVVAKNVEPAFAVLADIVLHPNFKQFSFDSEQQQWQDMVASSLADPGAIASVVAPSLAFGASHPYAHATATREGLANLQREDLRSFYQTWWHPDEAALVFAGSISLDEAVSLSEKYLGAWSGDTPKQGAMPAPENPGAGKVYLVDRPGASQTLIMEILPAIGQDDPQRIPLVLATQVWTTRLNASLRETMGDTYGFNAVFQPYAVSGEWIAGGFVQTDKTREAITELQRQTHRIGGERPMTDAELQEAKSTLARSYALGLETSSDVAAQLSETWVWHMPPSTLQSDPDDIARTPLSNVQAAAARFARLDKASLLLVGDRSRIESGLKDLGLEPIILLHTDGSPVAAANP